MTYVRVHGPVPQRVADELCNRFGEITIHVVDKAVTFQIAPGMAFGLETLEALSREHGFTFAAWK